MRSLAFLLTAVLVLTYAAGSPALWSAGRASTEAGQPVLAIKNQPISRYRDNLDYTIDRNSNPQFNPIGELETIQASKDIRGNEQHFYGTGFLISPCIVVTNHHVVFGDDLEPVPGKDYSMLFHVGISSNPGTAFLGNTKAIPLIWGKRGAASTNDWALMKLKTCVGARSDIGWLEFSESRQIDIQGRIVASAGYSGSKNRGILSFGLGRIFGIDRANEMAKHSASTGPGQSGGPLLIKEKGHIKVIGIDTIEFTHKETGENVFEYYSDRYTNEATLTDVIWNRSDLRNIIEDDRKKNGSNGNPAAKFMTADWPRPLFESKLS